MAENENKRDLFRDYLPKHLKKHRLRDTRFSKSQAWSGKKYQLSHPELYTPELISIFQNCVNTAISYLEGTALPELSKASGMTSTEIKRIAKEVISGKAMEYILRTHIGYENKLSLDLAIIELKIFKIEKQRLPTITDFSYVANAIIRGYWQSFGIMKWNDLLALVFGEINKVQGDYLGEDGLTRIQEKVRAFKKEHGRMPRAREKEFKAVIEALRRDIFKENGIRTWNDLLQSSVQEINLPRNRFSGASGLPEAVLFLKEFREKNQRLPTRTDQGMQCVCGAIERCEWKNNGIQCWNDMLFYCFGEVNVPRGRYVGKDALDKAIRVLEEFFKANGRMPRYSDGELSSVIWAVEHGNWIDFGIKTWGDLLLHVFKQRNDLVQIKEYMGEKGLDKAKYDLLAFRQKYNRLPKTRDKDITRILITIRRGEWIPFKIKTLNDLLKITFGSVEKNYGVFKGLTGLELAENRLIEFHRIHNRAPMFKDKNKGLSGVFKAVLRGEWASIGINTWNDLQRHVFGKVHSERNIFTGKAGLENAIQKIVDFKNVNHRNPNNKDKGMSGIVVACRRGEWSSLGIRSWRDLLKHYLEGWN